MTIHSEHVRTCVADLTALARRVGWEQKLEFELHILRLQGDQAIRYKNEDLAQKVLSKACALRERIEKALLPSSSRLDHARTRRPHDDRKAAAPMEGEA